MSIGVTTGVTDGKSFECHLRPSRELRPAAPRSRHSEALLPVGAALGSRIAVRARAELRQPSRPGLAPGFSLVRNRRPRSAANVSWRPQSAATSSRRGSRTWNGPPLVGALPTSGPSARFGGPLFPEDRAQPRRIRLLLAGSSPAESSVLHFVPNQLSSCLSGKPDFRQSPN